MIRFRHKGDLKLTTSFLERILNRAHLGKLDEYAKKGVDALASVTPKDTGETAASWYYEIEHTEGSTIIRWLNKKINDGVNIAIILQYGHATENGGWVEGTDYINPSIRPIFNEIAEGAWKEVTK